MSHAPHTTLLALLLSSKVYLDASRMSHFSSYPLVAFRPRPSLVDDVDVDLADYSAHFCWVPSSILYNWNLISPPQLKMSPSSTTSLSKRFSSTLPTMPPVLSRRSILQYCYRKQTTVDLFHITTITRM